MATIYNRASLTFDNNGTTQQVLSNLATATIMDPISISKSALAANYLPGDSIPFAITATNTCCCSLPVITICDNLGAFAACEGTVTPLTYDENAQLFINGISAGPITPTTSTENEICFTLPDLGRGDTATIFYTATVNEYAPLECGTTITNTITWAAGTCTGESSYTLTAACEADLRLDKSMSPNSICSGDLITYDFILSNYGNTAATGVILTDTFDPAPANITVSVDGTIIPATEYLYIDGILTLPNAESELTINVPAATFTRDENCAVVTTPGTVRISVTGALTTANSCCQATGTTEPILPIAAAAAMASYAEPTITAKPTANINYTCPCQRNS